MSAEIASNIGLSYNPNIVLNMQSTNGTMDQSLGLARNVPCTIGGITIYLQIHILRSPAYDILLGRPFDVLTRSTVNTISDIKTTITIMDPNTGQQCTIPTFPRGKFFELLNRILQQMKYCGGTFSGHKLVLCTLTFKILGHVFDMSYIAVGFYLCQCTGDNRKECHYNRFGSIMLNDREAQFSQPKLELYGLYRALQALQVYLIGVRNLIIEVNARYIKGMLQNPDIQPFASMNRWIMAILMFHFELVHVKGTFHGPDGLLQCPPQPGNPPIDNSDNSVYEDWINCLHRFIHQVQLPLLLLRQVSTASHRLPPLAEWSTTTYSVFWSEHVTVRKRMGCSPYFMTTGTYPLLPADTVEATYLQPPPNSLLSTTDLIACRAIDLQHRQEDLDHLHSQVLSARRLAAIRFKTEHAATICNYNFKTGDLVLMRNTRIEITHNKKMKPHYLGPLVVISCNRGGAYIVCELDGSVLHCPIAAFRLVPYFAREHIIVPSNAFDIDTLRLRELEQTELVDDDDTGEVASEEENYLSLSLSNFS
ncbi:hypothetical protein J132_04070 [Termitomyces sp. J132]|nr:hypothetical protein J132_04070 [Termitomyces sp. J132]